MGARRKRGGGRNAQVALAEVAGEERARAGFIIYLYPEEKAELLAAAERSSEPLGVWIRRVALERARGQ